MHYIYEHLYIMQLIIIIPQLFSVSYPFTAVDCIIVYCHNVFLFIELSSSKAENELCLTFTPVKKDFRCAFSQWIQRQQHHLQ